MDEVTINVAEQFTRFPAGRYRSDGRFSGERFRDDLLAPGLANGARVTVILDGTLGFGSSFLEEAFGGLVHSRGFALEDLEERLTFVSRDQSLVDEIWEYIQAAA